MRLLLYPALIALTAMAAPAPQRAAFPLFRFFEGRSEGRGTLKIITRAHKDVHVRSRGRILPDGTLVLDQIVERTGEAAKPRQWRIRELAPGRYTATLSDAQGPVTGETAGNRLHLAFKFKDGLDAEQWLTLADDGRSARNVMVVRKLGLKVATLDETIRKLD